MLRLHLEDAGHETAQAENGMHALEALDKDTFDAILLDMKMDVMDGLTFLGMMNRKGFSIPVIVITAFFQRKDGSRIYEAGCCGLSH